MLRKLAFAWSTHFAAICTLVLVEGLVIGSMGYRLERPEAFTHVWIPSSNWSADENRNWAAAKVYTRQKDSNAGASADVLMFNLLDRQFQPLGLEHLSPALIALSPDSKWLAIANTAGELLMVESPTSTPEVSSRTLENPLQRVFGLAFSDDGDYLAAVGEHDTILWDWHSGAIRWKTPSCRNRIGLLEFSPDCQSIATEGPKGQLIVLGTQSGSLLAQHYPSTNREIAAASWSSKFQAWVAVSKGEMTIEACRFDEDAPQSLWTHTTNMRKPVVAHNRETLAFTVACEDRNHGRVLLVDLCNGHVLAETCNLPIPSGIALAGSSKFFSWNFAGEVSAFDANERQWSTSLLDLASREWRKFPTSRFVSHSMLTM